MGAEVLALIVCTIPLIHLYLVYGGDYEPYQRGFFCDDENLKHPYLDEQISVHVCAAIWIVAVFKCSCFSCPNLDFLCCLNFLTFLF